MTSLKGDHGAFVKTGLLAVELCLVAPGIAQHPATPHLVVLPLVRMPMNPAIGPRHQIVQR